MNVPVQEWEQRDDDPLKKLKEQQKGMVTCRICKGDHWTTKCPYKDTLGATTIKELEESGELVVCDGERRPFITSLHYFQQNQSQWTLPPLWSLGACPGDQWVEQLAVSTFLRTSVEDRKVEGEIRWRQDSALEMVSGWWQ